MNKIPIEIQNEILSHCDLSATVALRDTCGSWRALCSESALATKVKSRVPWMVPGEHNTGLETWALCAKVILARRRACDSGRLEHVELLDRIPHFKKGKVVYLAAEEVYYLPEGYQSVFDSVYLRPVADADPQLLAHRNSDLYVNNRQVVIDLHSLNVKPTTTDIANEGMLEYEEREDNVYTCEGCSIELPEGAETIRFYAGKKQMVVYYDLEDQERVCVLEKKPKMSYKDGFVFDFDAEMMKVHVTREGVFLTQVEDPYFYTYWLDVASKSRTAVAKSEFEQPYDEWTLWYEDVMVYNGLLWHTFDEHVVPLVVDLEHLDKTGYNPKHIIQWNDGGETQQGDDGSESFFGSKTSTTQATDMATYTNYRVKEDRHYDLDDVVFPGTINGQFRFWKWGGDYADQIINAALTKVEE
ncbi:hypothetical protein CJU89_2559 [Yarrowia sp. B02]|nr:hypothetical protein CJU89_2559 [Yarrowia sp. B02]